MNIEFLRSSLVEVYTNIEHQVSTPLYDLYYATLDNSKKSRSIVVYKGSNEEIKKMHEIYTMLKNIKNDMLPSIEDIFPLVLDAKHYLAVVVFDKLGETFFEFAERVNESPDGIELSTAINFCLSLTIAVQSVISVCKYYEIGLSSLSLIKANDTFQMHGWGLPFHQARIDFLSPEEFPQFINYDKSHTTKNETNKERSIVYSLGIIFLQALSLKSSDFSGVNALEKGFKEGKLSKICSIIRKKHGEGIDGLIHRMLTSEDKRPDLKTVSDDLHNILREINRENIGVIHPHHKFSASLDKSREWL